MAVTRLQTLIDAYTNGEIALDALLKSVVSETRTNTSFKTELDQALVDALASGKLTRDEAAKIIAVLPIDVTRAAVADVSIESSETVLEIGQATAAVGHSRGNTAKRAGMDEEATVVAFHEDVSVSIEVGNVLGGRYELEQVVGEGGMGVVYKAKDRNAEDKRNPFVAIKVLSEDFRRHPDALEAMRHEVLIAKGMRQDNVVRVDGWDKDGDYYYVIMELLRGKPLDRYVREREEPLTFEEILAVIEGAGTALRYAHERKRVVHCDIKPNNIWVNEDGGIKVLDFGIARAVDPDTKTKWEGIAAAALRYASPERLKREPPDFRDDVYALACVTYELVTGNHPFNGIDALAASRADLKPEKPEGLNRRQWRGLQRGLNFDRAERTPSVREFLDDLRAEPAGRNLSTNVLARYALAAFLIALVGWTVAYFLGQETPAERYAKTLMGVVPTDTLSESDVSSLLDDAAYFFDRAVEDFGDGNAEAAHMRLKGGTTTATRPLYLVLHGTTATETRQRAVELLAEIEESYVTAIDKLAVDDPARALKLTCLAMTQPMGFDVPVWPEYEAHYYALWDEVNNRTLASAAPPMDEGCAKQLAEDPQPATRSLFN